MKYVFTLLVIVPLLLGAQMITPDEMDIYDSMLARQQLNLQSVNFLKDWAGDTRLKIPTVTRAINQPFTLPALADDFRQQLKQPEPDSLFAFIGQMLYESSVVVPQAPQLPQQLTPQSIATYFTALCDAANELHQRMWRHLDANRQAELRDYMLSLYQEPQDSLRYRDYYRQQGIRQFLDGDSAELIAMIQRLDFAAGVSAARLFSAGCNQLYAAVQATPLLLAKPREIATPWGLCQFGTSGDDAFTGPAVLRYDPAGNDDYFGTMGSDFDHPFFCHIDLAGDDRYQTSHIGGLFGVQSGAGFVRDAAGRDCYRGSDIALSALFGFLDFADAAGDDVYDLGLFAAGAAAYGIALVTDASGNDTYRITQFGEGFGGTLGCGLLQDAQGNDLYYAGGRYDHAPLAPYDFRSMAQGFGFGGRPDFAGGIGILHDSQGNDRYNGGVYAQGVGYWYALGLLLDEAGNDFYTAVYYPQGSGIHLAGGLLFDGAGEDHYYSKHGPGQGAGHDYGVGFLVDRAGNDTYSVEGGNGLGITNSVGVFLDAWGDDQYAGHHANSYGYANKTRDSGGIGLFLDAGGQDAYLQPFCANDSLWTRGTFGAGLDTLFAAPPQPIQAEADTLAATVDSLAAIDEIFTLASRWGVGNEAKRVKRAGEILLQRDAESAQYIYEHAMDSKSSLVYRAIATYAKVSVQFNPYLLKALEHSDSLVVKNAISLLGTTADTLSIGRLEAFLARSTYITTVLGALGAMKSDSVLPVLQRYMDDSSEKVRVVVARGFKRINTPAAQALLAAMADDPSFIIQTMVRLHKPKE
jgi:hypothetical protein